MNTDVSRIRQVGERLRGELAALVAAFPPEARRLAGMTGWLKIDRSTCQRVLAGVEHRGDPVDVVAKVPGVRGMRNVVRAGKARGVAKDIVAGAEAAISDFSESIAENGGSQSSLMRRLAESRSHTTDRGLPGESARGQRSESERQVLFEAAAATMRTHMEVRLGIVLLRPCPSDPQRIESGLINGKIGVVRVDGACPLITGISHIIPDVSVHPLRSPSDQPLDSVTDAEARQHTQSSYALRRFTTHPLPTITTKVSDACILHTVDPDRARPGPIDLVEGRRLSPGPHNPLANTSIPVINNGLAVEPAARHLVSDVYVHHDLARASIATVGVYTIGPHGILGDHEHPRNRWYVRVTHQPDLRVLGPGIGQAHCDAYPRHGELTQFLFDSLEADPASYFGYRCEERYPLWGMDYDICLDFTRPTNGSE